MKFMGIDPGAFGAVAILDKDSRELVIIDMPTLKVKRGPRVVNQVDGHMLADALRLHVTPDTSALIEKVHAMPGQGVSSMFSFGRAAGIVEGDTVYLADTQSATRVTSTFLEENRAQGYTFYEVVEPVEIEGKMRRIIGFPDGSYQTNRISNVIPYRAGEYRRIYSDEYFVKIKSVYEVDGKLEQVVQTHRTASSVAEANAYVKALNEAKTLHAAGNLTIAEASRLQPESAHHERDGRNDPGF